jgi:hypothetical protein
LSDDEHLARAIAIASVAHETQWDKNGAPYILHPLRLLHQAIAKDLPRSAQIVAVLHDVLEDCPEWTAERLRHEGFIEEVLMALAHVTKRPDEENDYDKFIERICHAPGVSGRIARQVKLLDLEDNLDIRRLNTLTEKDVLRLQKYQKARQALLSIGEKDL